MTEEALIIMLRDNDTGFLEKEYAKVPLSEIDGLEPFLVGIFAKSDDSGANIHVKLSTGRDVSNWEYNAVYDYYDDTVFAETALSVSEQEAVFNPTWEVVFKSPYNEASGAASLALKLREVLEIHRRELADTLDIITGVESEYTDG